jgi:small GTP-binding protein
MNVQNKSESRFIKGRTDIKIVVLGSSGTGKTSFCNLWVNNTFSEEYKATVMSEFSFKMYNYKGNYYKVQIWDLAGQDKNIYTSKVFTKGSHGCLILYDTQDKKSFENTIKWKKSIDENTTFIDGTPLPIVLVQNKIDLVQAEELEKDEEELKKFVEDNDFLTFTRTSCKNNQNINETMDFLLANIIDRLEDYHKKANIPIDNNKRTSIVIQNPSLSSESLLNSNRNFCCW